MKIIVNYYQLLLKTHQQFFYALGDWGTGNAHPKAVAAILQQDLKKIDTLGKPFVLGLGDNVYPDGLPDKAFKSREVVDILNRRFGQAYNGIKYKGQSITFHTVPGNHDYHNSHGRLHEETTAEALFNGEDDTVVFRSYPIHHGKTSDTNDVNEHRELKRRELEEIALPQTVIDNTDLLIIAIDTPLYLRLYSQKKTSVLEQHWSYLQKKIQASSAKWKLIFGHHPIQSYGTHSGFRSLREWTWTGTRDVIPYYLRPFTFLWLTSITVMADYALCAVRPYKQDLIEDNYQKFIRDFSLVIEKNDIDFYIAGHDHNLQFLDLGESSFQIISGSAGKLNAVSHGKDTIFSSGSRWFCAF